MGVDEFLGQVRRMVVDFVVGRVLIQGEDADLPGDHPLDDVATYYLLHRADFGLNERSLLERLANHLRQLGSTVQATLALGD